MKVGDFKKIIKEAVKEVFQEEMKEILLESIRSSKTRVVEHTQQMQPSLSETSKQAYRDLMGSMFNPNGGQNFTTNTMAYTPPPISTVGEGTALPPGEVNLDQIMGLMKN